MMYNILIVFQHGSRKEAAFKALLERRPLPFESEVKPSGLPFIKEEIILHHIVCLPIGRKVLNADTPVISVHISISFLLESVNTSPKNIGNALQQQHAAPESNKPRAYIPFQPQLGR